MVKLAQKFPDTLEGSNGLFCALSEVIVGSTSPQKWSTTSSACCALTKHLQQPIHLVPFLCHLGLAPADLYIPIAAIAGATGIAMVAAPAVCIPTGGQFPYPAFFVSEDQLQVWLMLHTTGARGAVVGHS